MLKVECGMKGWVASSTSSTKVDCYGHMLGKHQRVEFERDIYWYARNNSKCIPAICNCGRKKFSIVERSLHKDNCERDFREKSKYTSPIRNPRDGERVHEVNIPVR